MRWLMAPLFLAMLNMQEEGAFPLLSGKRIKKLLDSVLGVEKWSVAVTSGDDVEETANIAEKMQKIIIQSDNFPETSDMDNSTILMDFKKGMMAALFLDTDMGHMCFFTEDDSSFGPSASEILGRKNATTAIQLGNPVTYYALNSHRIMTGPALLKMGGVAVYKMCGHCIDNGKVYHVIKDSTKHMKPRTLTASGFVSATQPGKSVPIIFKMEEDSMGDNVIHDGMSAHAQNMGNDKDMKDMSMQHDMKSDMSMKKDDIKSSKTDLNTDDKTKMMKMANTDDNLKVMKITNTDDKAKIMKITNTNDETKVMKITNVDEKAKVMKITNTDDKTKEMKIKNTDDKTKVMKIKNTDDKTKVMIKTNTDNKAKVAKIVNTDDKMNVIQMINTNDKTKATKITNTDDNAKEMKIVNTDDKTKDMEIKKADDKMKVMKIASTDDKAKGIKITNTDDKKTSVDSEVDIIQNLQTAQSQTAATKPQSDATTETVVMTTTPRISTMSTDVIRSESSTAKDMTSAPTVTIAPSTVATRTANSIKADDTAVSKDTKDSFGTVIANPMNDDKTDNINSNS